MDGTGKRSLEEKALDIQKKIVLLRMLYMAAGVVLLFIDAAALAAGVFSIFVFCTTIWAGFGFIVWYAENTLIKLLGE